MNPFSLVANPASNYASILLDLTSKHGSANLFMFFGYKLINNG